MANVKVCDIRPDKIEAGKKTKAACICVTQSVSRAKLGDHFYNGVYAAQVNTDEDLTSASIFVD